MSKQKKKWTTFSIWFLLLFVLYLFYTVDQSDGLLVHEEYASFIEDIEQGRVASIRVQDNQIHVELNDGSPKYVTLGVVDDEVTQSLSDIGAHVSWGKPPRPFRTLLTVALPLLLLVVFLLYFIKKARTSGNGVFALGKSKARLVTDNCTTFDDVGGCDEAKASLGDVIDFLRNNKRWAAAGARLPRGILLEGPPGCGKTLLARAVAGETNASFYTVSASEFVELFVGVGAARVRDMFETAAKAAPAVIFIDELDAVGRRRGSGVGAGHDEREQTLNQLLVCLDGFDKHERVVVIAATNRSDILDPALLRPGRFDRRIQVPVLSSEARLRTLQIHARERPLGDDVSLEDLARRTDGYTGAQLESLLNEATLLAVRRAGQSDNDHVTIVIDDFLQPLYAERSESHLFDQLDALLIESVTQLARPKGATVVRIELSDNVQMKGEIVWADAAFVKVRKAESGAEMILPKHRIQSIAALEGTDFIGAEEVAVDHWAHEVPGMA